MNSQTLSDPARQLMEQFALDTGLTGDNPPRRYLWTDAFAVCNYLGFHEKTGEDKYRDLAETLIGQVHETLGRHRDDDPRTGWLSGLGEEEGAEHPTRGGLRIGKDEPERGPSEPLDPDGEWDRDGQYYHYLTRWMHALVRAGNVANQSDYHRYAAELAAAAHKGFTYPDPNQGPPRMYWKMSIDLSYPLVESMGHHDPLDGLITYHEINAAVEGDPLNEEIAEMRAICQGKHWATADPLGIGGLLNDAARVAQLILHEAPLNQDLPAEILEAATTGLRQYALHDSLKRPALQRLAFRECGLAIGLRAARRTREMVADHPQTFTDPDLPRLLEHIDSFQNLADDITEFWLQEDNRDAPTWTGHQEINTVMLATTLEPGGYLGI